MDATSIVMELLRAVTEQSESATTITTPTGTTITTKPNTPTTASSSSTSTSPSHYVSQFRIGGRPILPPLMTEEKRCEMQQLRQLAVQLEEKFEQARVIRSLPELGTATAMEMERSQGGRHSMPQLQQTETFIFDSTQQPERQVIQVSPLRRRPQTLDLELELPLICVDPPTPQLASLNNSLLASPVAVVVNATPTPSAASPPSVCSPTLSARRRKVNSITPKILHFEQRSGLEGTPSPSQTSAAAVVWLEEKRMLRSSTSPSLIGLSAAAEKEKEKEGELEQLQPATLMLRSRSFTLEQPSQALVEHMQRETPLAPPPPSPSPPPPPLLLPLASRRVAAPVPCALRDLRRDTVESKAKRVQRSDPRSAVSTISARSTSGSNCSVSSIKAKPSPNRPFKQRSSSQPLPSQAPAHVQAQSQLPTQPAQRPQPPQPRLCTSTTLRNQQQLEELLESTLRESSSCNVDHERVQLVLAKRKMFHDIKCAHRDRFQQLVQYQHEEQRRMQEEFDRQQKFLIDEICADINVNTYAAGTAHDPKEINRSISSVSEYTSTEDLEQPPQSPHSSISSEQPASSSGPSTPSTTVTLTSLATTPRSFVGLDEFLELEQSCRKTNNPGQPPSAARKRLFANQPQNWKAASPTTTPTGGNKSAKRSPPNRKSSPVRQRLKKSSQSSNHSHTHSQAQSPRSIKSPTSQSSSKAPAKSAANRSGAATPTAQLKSKSQLANLSNLSQSATSPRDQHRSSSKSRKSGAASPHRQIEKKSFRPLRPCYAQLAEPQRHDLAATRLCAGARGFLVRRLFRTEQVQRLVQTIRDTLIFVLNLHLETCDNNLEEEAPANIRLKARLLQQLCSASRTLHLVFFQTSIKERMEMIARDRKRIKTKLLALHVKRRL